VNCIRILRRKMKAWPRLAWRFGEHRIFSIPDEDWSVWSVSAESEAFIRLFAIVQRIAWVEAATSQLLVAKSESLRS